MKRFSCENCGGDVRERDDICPHCAAVFVAIRCPQCGYHGKQHHFRMGCPVCGYMGNELPPQRPVQGSTVSSAPPPAPPRKKRPMPEWLFWFILGSLVVSFVILAIIYTRM